MEDKSSHALVLSVKEDEYYEIEQEGIKILKELEDSSFLDKFKRNYQRLFNAFRLSYESEKKVNQIMNNKSS
jgi:hypothetical protein